MIPVQMIQLASVVPFLNQEPHILWSYGKSLEKAGQNSLHEDVLYIVPYW